MDYAEAESLDLLEHVGVKGMKWGVRKDSKPGYRSRYREIRNETPATQSFTAKNGKTVIIREDRAGRLQSAIGASNAKHRAGLKDFKSLTIEVDGKKVGDAQIAKESDDELNLVWLGVRKSERGKGYASAVFEGAVQHGRANGYKKLTLEVPGNSPDARHIYEKAGFKSTGKVDGDSKDIWGGLSHMEYDIERG